MLNFFLTKYHPDQLGIKQYSKFDYIRSRYQFEINKITEYYQHRIRAIYNNNIFSRVITLMSPDINLDLFEYFKYVDQDAPYIARQFNMVNNISQGKMYKNIFYEDNSYAIINHVSNDINLYSIRQNWRQLAPLRCIYTRTYNLDFYQMDKKKIPSSEELTVVEIDIVMMLLQYRFWAVERLLNDNSTNPNVYVYTILYPNFVNTIIDIKLFNRFINVFNNRNMVTADIKHPFHVLDYSNGIDQIYKQVQKDFTHSNPPLQQVLETIPTIYNKDMIHALYINNPYYTKQSEWSLWLSRIDYIVFLLDFLGDRGIARNRMYVNRLPSLIKRLENGSTIIESKIPPHMYKSFTESIEKIKEKIGRR